MDDSQPEESRPERKGLRLQPDNLVLGMLALATVVALGFAAENRRLSKQNQILAANYGGVVAVLNNRKPCNCHEQETSANGTTGLHSTETTDSSAAPEQRSSSL